jgi:hypothetical protein
MSTEGETLQVSVPSYRCSIYLSSLFFLIQILGGGVQLAAIGTVVTNRPIVPTLGDYDEGDFGRMMIGRGNRSTRRKPAQCHFVHHKSHML